MNRREANEQLAAQLLQARDAVRLAANPSHFGFDLTVGRGYQIGRALHERLVSRGLKPFGRKIGFTNRSMWEQFKVSEPIWAHVYEQTVHFAQEGNLRLSLAGMVAPRIEPEIVLRLRSAMPSGELSVEELATCIEWAAVGLEIVDTHFADWRFNAAEAVADFGLHAALVVGPPWRVDSEAPNHLAAVLESLRVTLRGSNDLVAEGEGRNALGGPLLALGFLARVLSTQPWAGPLMPGEVITTGTLTAFPYVQHGGLYRVEVVGAPLAPLQLELGE